MMYIQFVEHFECGISPLTNSAQTQLREQYVHDYLQQCNLQSVQDHQQTNLKSPPLDLLKTPEREIKAEHTLQVKIPLKPP